VSCQQGRHNNQSPQIGRYPVTERQPGECLWSKQRHNVAIHQGDRQVQGWNEREQPEKKQAHCPARRRTGIPEEHSEDESTHERDGSEIPRRRLRQIGTPQPTLDGHAKTEFLLEGDTSLRDEVVAGIRSAVFRQGAGSRRFGLIALRVAHRPLGNVKLRVR